MFPQSGLHKSHDFEAPSVLQRRESEYGKGSVLLPPYNFPLFARYSCVAESPKRKTRASCHRMTLQNGIRIIRQTREGASERVVALVRWGQRSILHFVNRASPASLHMEARTTCTGFPKECVRNLSLALQNRDTFLA